VLRENFLAEDFHTTKKFVLVCTTDPAFELRGKFEPQPKKTGAFRSKINGSSYFINGSIKRALMTSRQGAAW